METPTCTEPDLRAPDLRSLLRGSSDQKFWQMHSFEGSFAQIRAFLKDVRLLAAGPVKTAWGISDSATKEHFGVSSVSQ